MSAGCQAEYPLPVDPDLVDAAERGESGADLVRHDARHRAGRGGEGHANDGGPPLEGDGPDEAEVDDVHAQVRVDDVEQRLADGDGVLPGRFRGDTGGRGGQREREGSSDWGGWGTSIPAVAYRPAGRRTIVTRQVGLWIQSAMPWALRRTRMTSSAACALPSATTSICGSRPRVFRLHDYRFSSRATDSQVRPGPKRSRCPSDEWPAGDGAQRGPGIALVIRSRGSSACHSAARVVLMHCPHLHCPRLHCPHMHCPHSGPSAAKPPRSAQRPMST